MKKQLFLKSCVLAVMVMGSVGVGILLGNTINKSNTEKHIIAGTVDKYAEEQSYDKIVERTSISIPGYDFFEFKANETKQNIILYNPKENTCYFEISFILEDGTKIWTSDLLEPDMSFTSINLDKTLDVGTYENVQLKYECYSLKDLEQLNGADIKVTLFVK